MHSPLLAILLVLFASTAYCGDLTKWYQVKGGSWEVPSSVASAISDRIQAAAKGASTPRGREVPSLASYIVQYQGVQPNGKRVKIRGACKAEDQTQLKSTWVEVFDGGICYFQALYDVEQKTFTQFSFNGEA